MRVTLNSPQAKYTKTHVTKIEFDDGDPVLTFDGGRSETYEGFDIKQVIDA